MERTLVRTGAVTQRKRGKDVHVAVESGALRLSWNGEAEFPLRAGTRVLDRFLHEGKATIVLRDGSWTWTALLSDAQPRALARLLSDVRDEVARRERAEDCSPRSLAKMGLAAQTPAGLAGKEKLVSQDLLRRGAQPWAPRSRPTAAVAASQLSPESEKRRAELSRKRRMHEHLARHGLAAHASKRMRKYSSLPPQPSIISVPQAEQPNRMRVRRPAIAAAEPLATRRDAVDVAQLSVDQRRVYDAVMDGQSVFFTGSAGTGKTFLIQALVDALPAETTFVTATTGAAACHIGGTSLHHFAGIGCNDSSDVDRMASAALRFGRQRWTSARVLIIDEVSMLDADMFDALDHVARVVRRDSRPFGGIQLVLSGDFLQLPPVARHGAAEKQFCFKAAAWAKAIGTTVELRRVFRQQGDDDFIRVLQQIRMGECPDDVEAILRDRCSPLFGGGGADSLSQDGIVPTRLYAVKSDVNEVNRHELEKLRHAEQVVFEAKDVGNERLLETSCVARQRLVLKVGAQVLLLKNIDVAAGLVNGARGVVVAFKGLLNLPVVRFAGGLEMTVAMDSWQIRQAGAVIASREQLPLDLGYALSMHKCQGQTLDAVEIGGLDRCFEYGQVYVALSRGRSLDKIRIIGDFDAKSIRAHPEAIEFYRAIARQAHAAEQAA